MNFIKNDVKYSLEIHLNKLKSNSDNILNNIIKSLDDVQNRMLSKAKKRLNDNTLNVSSYDKFKEIIKSQMDLFLVDE